MAKSDEPSINVPASVYRNMVERLERGQKNAARNRRPQESSHAEWLADRWVNAMREHEKERAVFKEQFAHDQAQLDELEEVNNILHNRISTLETTLNECLEGSS
jgi:chromosome segregation ATPase